MTTADYRFHAAFYGVLVTPDPNPFPTVVLAVVEVRVELEALERTLTLLLDIVQGEQDAGFAPRLVAHLTRCVRECQAISGRMDQLHADTHALVARAQSGEDLHGFDTAVPGGEGFGPPLSMQERSSQLAARRRSKRP